jgi:hypothetical protein
LIKLFVYQDGGTPAVASRVEKIGIISKIAFAEGGYHFMVRKLVTYLSHSNI